MKENKIVSVVVITYNSSETIVETLNSIKCQTYRKNIELIISDDFSTDDTVAVMQQWLDDYGHEIYSSELLQAPSNRGIVGNLNYGVKKSTGFYLKFIAGDDILLESSTIETCIELCNGFEGIFTPVSNFFDIESIVNTSPLNYQSFIDDSAENKKLKFLINSNVAPNIVGFFCKRSVCEKLGYFDSNYPMMEDYPFIVKLFDNYSISDFNFTNQTMFGYRLRGQLKKEFIVSKRKYMHTLSLNNFRKNVILPKLISKGYYKYCCLIILKIYLLRIETNSVMFAKVTYFLRKIV